MAITGECFCGEVRYRINGELHDARCCHCSRCRKAFSAAGSAYALVTPGEFEWLAGQSLLRTYASQEGAGLRFCGQCGSTLCGEVGGQVHGITLGCLNDDPPVAIQRHIFTDSKACWDEIGGDAPQYPAAP
jgi:hypothetical protein